MWQATLTKIPNVCINFTVCRKLNGSDEVTSGVFHAALESFGRPRGGACATNRKVGAL